MAGRAHVPVGRAWQGWAQDLPGRRVYIPKDEHNRRPLGIQSNEEGVLVSQILGSPEAFNGIILNPAAYTHTSVALRDALQAVTVPCVEVHLTNTAAREEFRHVSLTAGACLGQIMGFGAMGYHLALIGLVQYLKSGRGPG
ncbi:MAG: type II 3-dehydroquinate dehydratase [Verrucomicrobia bacterium]|nr:type II 3-dehydroquinate dehydratase [Verrucomicrobiota bacterium]